MKCHDLLRMLNDYVDGDIDPAICKEFDKHLAGCNPCRIVVDNIRRTIVLYKDGREYPLPVGCRKRLHAALKKKWTEARRTTPARRRRTDD
jgi:anti-sigma factor RsiW